MGIKVSEELEQDLRAIKGNFDESEVAFMGWSVSSGLYR